MAIIPSLLYIKWTKVSDAKHKWLNYIVASFYLLLGLLMAFVGTYVTLVK